MGKVFIWRAVDDDKVVDVSDQVGEGLVLFIVDDEEAWFHATLAGRPAVAVECLHDGGVAGLRPQTSSLRQTV